MRLQVISRIPTKQDDQIDFVYSGETKLERWTNNIGCLSGIIILLMIVIPVIVMLIGDIIGVRIEGQGFDVFLERGMRVGFLLLLIGILLKIYIKIIRPLMGSESDRKRVSAESEWPTRLVSETQVETLPSITEYTTELLRGGDERDKEQRPTEPSNRA